MPPVPPQPVQLNCPACSTPFRTAIYTLIDVSEEPELKFALLGGQLNVAVCPNCGTPSRLSVQIVYHDAPRQLCLVHIPQEQNLPPEEQERFVGEATNFLIRALPPNAPRAYLLAPRRFLTLASLAEAILEAEGPNRKAIEREVARRIHLSFLQGLAGLLATDEEQFDALVESQHEAFSPEFFEDLEAFLQTMPPEVEPSRGLLQEVQRRLEQLVAQGDDGASEIDLAEVVQRMIDLPEAELEAAVAELRPDLEYEFFVLLTAQIEAAEAAGDHELAAALTARRERIRTLGEQIDERLQAMFEVGSALLEEVLAAPDPVAALHERADRVDEDFLTVLALNRSAAASTGQHDLEHVLGELEAATVTIIEGRMTPEQRFISELMAQETPQEATRLLRKQVAKINPALVSELNQQAEHEERRGNSPVAERLRQLARECGAMLF